jgi:alcohol dehydrogenase (cytochrome c)
MITTESTRAFSSNLDYGGKAHKLLVHPDRNGYLYLMDRSTGEVLYAKPFAPITTSTGVDLETGKLQ